MGWGIGSKWLVTKSPKQLRRCAAIAKRTVVDLSAREAHDELDELFRTFARERAALALEVELGELRAGFARPPGQEDKLR